MADGRALVRLLDVTEKAASETIGRDLAALGGVYIPVNNASVMPVAPTLEDRVEEWQQTTSQRKIFRG